MRVGIGDEFHRTTKYVRGKMAGGYLDWSKKPGIYKHYPNSTKIKFPFPKQVETISLDEALKKRRSIRAFSQKPMTMEQLSYLL